MVASRPSSRTATAIEAAGIRARYLVGADGLHSTRPAPARPGGRHPAGDRASASASTSRWRRGPTSSRCTGCPTARCTSRPSPRDSVGVAVLGGAPLSLDDAVARLPALAARLSGAPASSQQARGRTASPVDHGADSRARPPGGRRRGLRRRAHGGGAAGRIRRGGGRRAGGARRRPSQRYEARVGRASPARTAGSPTGCCGPVPEPRLRPMIVPAAQRLPFAFRRIVDSLAS